MLNNLRSYAEHFLVILRDKSMEVLKRAVEASNFLRIAVVSNPNVFHNTCFD